MKKETFEFGLKVGMTADDLMKELEGNVSGETQQVVQEFKRNEIANHWRSTIHIPMYDDGLPGSEKIGLLESAKQQEKQKEPDVPFSEFYGCEPPSHQVIKADNENCYAIVVKNFWITGLCVACGGGHLLHLGRRHYILGINEDSNKYFIHDLHGVESSLPTIHSGWSGSSIYDVVDWVNKVDEGFEFPQYDLNVTKKMGGVNDESSTIIKNRDMKGRLQGDILYQMLHVEKGHSVHEPNHNHIILTSKDDYPVLNVYLKIKRENRTWTNEYEDKLLQVETTPWSNYSDPVTDTTLLGRHELKVRNGLIYPINEFLNNKTNGNTTEYWLVVGHALELMHPEHKQVVKRIPENYVCLITAQRGRAPETKFD